MTRNRRKKALYEVLGKAKLKPANARNLTKPEDQKADESQDAEQMPEEMTGWPKRPRICQLNNGKIEISIPYQLAIAILLGIILLVLVFYRLGQLSYSSKDTVSNLSTITSSSQQQAAKRSASTFSESTTQPKKSPVMTDKFSQKIQSQPTEPVGDNRIVIQTYHAKAGLLPVQKYFAKLGIDTQIRQIGTYYYLVTAEKYENPGRKGTDGYKTLQKIIELGKNYEAPEGYESFGKQPFHDAYGMKFEN